MTYKKYNTMANAGTRICGNIKIVGARYTVYVSVAMHLLFFVPTLGLPSAPPGFQVGCLFRICIACGFDLLRVNRASVN